MALASYPAKGHLHIYLKDSGETDEQLVEKGVEQSSEQLAVHSSHWPIKTLQK